MEPKPRCSWCLMWTHPTSLSQILHHLYNILQCTSWHQGGHIQSTRYRQDRRNTSPKTTTLHSNPTSPRTTVLHHTPSTTPTGVDTNDRRCQWTDLEPWIRCLPNIFLSSHGVIQTSSHSRGQSRTQCGLSTGPNCRADEALTLYCRPS